MEGPLVPEAAAPAVIDLVGNENPAKKRRVRERLPKPNYAGVVYSLTYKAGFPLFCTEFANEAYLLAKFPTHFALDKHHVKYCREELQRALWKALSPDEIRAWNNRVEPDHETKVNERKEAENLNEKRANRNRFIRGKLDQCIIPGFGGFFRDIQIDRDAVLAEYAKAYDAAAAEYDAAHP